MTTNQIKSASSLKEKSERPAPAPAAHLASLEQERARIAREIHDEMGGNLTAIKMALAMLRKNLPEDVKIAEQAAYLDSLVDRSIDAMHRLANNLRPAVLDLGLIAACEWQVQEFVHQNGIACQFISQYKDLLLHADLVTILFRVLQESLTNIAKHANAANVHVTLEADSHTVCLRVADDGCGLSTAALANHNALGIRGMIDRAREAGGTLVISNNVGGGSVVSATIPRIA